MTFLPNTVSCLGRITSVRHSFVLTGLCENRWVSSVYWRLPRRRRSVLLSPCVYRVSKCLNRYLMMYVAEPRICPCAAMTDTLSNNLLVETISF